MAYGQKYYPPPAEEFDWCAVHIRNLPELEREAVLERAAILEYDAGLSRLEANRMAYKFFREKKDGKAGS